MGDRSEGLGAGFPDGHGVDEHGAPVQSENEGLFLLRLLGGPGEPLSGSIGLVHQPTEVAFRGWIDFMVAVNRLRSEKGGAPRSHG
jgi:hypothetical protein